MQNSSGSSASGGAVKAISSQDYQSSLGQGSAQIGNHSSGGGSGAQITTKSANTAGNWMDDGSSTAQTKRHQAKGCNLANPKNRMNS